jgi:hypothetical protein
LQRACPGAHHRAGAGEVIPHGHVVAQRPSPLAPPRRLTAHTSPQAISDTRQCHP